MIEVDRPDRRARRAGGKSDPIDASAAAAAVLTGRTSGTPKARDGIVEAIRALRIVRRSAVKARTQTINQIRTLIITALDEVREQLRAPNRHRLNRGGDRRANHALHMIALVRMRYDQRTQDRPGPALGPRP